MTASGVQSTNVISEIRSCGVVPVLIVNDARVAVAAAKALLAGGIGVTEVTFRTEAAAAAISAIRREVPEMLVGAGTILDSQALEQAIAAGATFGVAPGYDPEIAKAAQSKGFLFLPGVMTPSEVGRAIRDGFRTLKFFPAENAGGAKTLAAVMAPYLHLKPQVIPTGGISSETIGPYLKLPYVIAAGASWVCPAKLMDAGKWEEITQLSRTAVEAIRATRGVA